MDKLKYSHLRLVKGRHKQSLITTIHLRQHVKSKSTSPVSLIEKVLIPISGIQKVVYYLKLFTWFGALAGCRLIVSRLDDNFMPSRRFFIMGRVQ